MRYFAMLIALLMIPLTAYGFGLITASGGGGPALVASGSCTEANLLVNAENGYALVDFGTANELTDYANGTYYIIITDSGSHTLEGYIKAAGDGEDLGANLHNDDFTAGGWTPVNGLCTIVDADTWTTTGISGPYNNILDLYSLYKVVLDISVASGVVDVYTLISGGKSALWGTNTGTHYGISDDTGAGVHGFFLRNSAASNPNDVTNLDIYKVTGPTNTGVTIVTESGGTTYNWKVRNAAFLFNTSNITYEIWSGM